MLLLSLTTSTSTELLLLLSTAEKKESTKRKVSHGHYECQEGTRKGRGETEGDACHTPFLLSVNFHAAPFVFISIKRTE